MPQLKSRAKRILTINAPATKDRPAAASRVLRSRTVKFQAEPVPVFVELKLPQAVTILPGETVTVDEAFLSLPIVKRLVASRELLAVKAKPQSRRATLPPAIVPDPPARGADNGDQ